MKKLVNIRKYILLGSAALNLILLGIFLIWGSSAEKIKLSVLTLLLPLVLYGFIRVAFFAVSKNASAKVMAVFSYFFLIAFFLGGTLLLISIFAAQFPNGYAPALPALFGGIMGILDHNAKPNC